MANSGVSDGVARWRIEAGTLIYSVVDLVYGVAVAILAQRGGDRNTLLRILVERPITTVSTRTWPLIAFSKAWLIGKYSVFFSY